MKDYIYLDEDLLNSNLAQLNQGLPSVSQTEDTRGTTRRTDSQTSNAKGLDGLFGFGSQYLKQTAETDGFEMISSQKEVLESVFHDYAVDLLLDSIPIYDNLVDNILDANEGDFIYIKEKFTIYDFSHLSKALNLDYINSFVSSDDENTLKEIKKKKTFMKAQKVGNAPSAKEALAELDKQIAIVEAKITASKESIKNLEMIQKVSDYCNNLFPNSTLIRISSGLIFSKKECFRNSIEQISLLTESKREISVIGIVSSIKEKTYQQNLLTSFSASDISKIPSMINDIMLSSFGIMKSGDKLIKPIAIFFE